MPYRMQYYRTPAPKVRRSRISFPVVVVASAALLAVAVGGIVAWNAFLGGGGTATSASSAAPFSLFRPDGTPLVEGPLKVAGVEVPDPTVDLGRQPLDTAVEKVFRLRNTSSTAVALGRPSIKVLQGCCPSDPILNATSIQPGEEVPLVFSLPMGMHKGMDGPHLFSVTVPVQNAGEFGNVELFVKADFR